jgi:hypothetical protein
MGTSSDASPGMAASPKSKNWAISEVISGTAIPMVGVLRSDKVGQSRPIAKGAVVWYRTTKHHAFRETSKLEREGETVN